MLDSTTALNSAVNPDFIADELVDRSKGYSRGFRNLLVVAAKLIKGYQQVYPFKDCIGQWQHAFAMAGMHMAADVVTKLGHPDLATTIRAQEISMKDLNASVSRIMLHYASLQRARVVLTELQAAGLLDSKYDKDLKAIFYDLEISVELTPPPIVEDPQLTTGDTVLLTDQRPPIDNGAYVICMDEGSGDVSVALHRNDVRGDSLEIVAGEEKRSDDADSAALPATETSV